MRRADVERHRTPVGVTVSLGAGLQGVLRLHVRVGIVTHAAGAPMRILLRVETGQQRPHLMAAEALPLCRAQLPRGRIEGDELSLGSELVARVAVELLLVGQRLQVRWIEPRRHPAQPDPHIVGEMTALLGAGGVGRLKPVGRARVAGKALHVLQCRGVRLEMGAVAGGGGDPLPGFPRFTLDVTSFADLAGDLGVRRDAVRARHDPVVELLALRLQLEGMAGMTGEAVVRALQLVDQEIGPRIGAHEDLAAGHEDVTAGAKIIVVHDIIVGLEPTADYQKQHGRHGTAQGQFDSAVPGYQPVPDLLSPAPQQHQDPERHQRPDHDPADHHPAGPLKNPLDDGDERIGQGRAHYHRIDESAGQRILHPAQAIESPVLDREGPRPHGFDQVDGGHDRWGCYRDEIGRDIEGRMSGRPFIASTFFMMACTPGAAWGNPG